MTKILPQAKSKYSHTQSHNYQMKNFMTTDQAKSAEHNLMYFLQASKKGTKVPYIWTF